MMFLSNSNKSCPYGESVLSVFLMKMEFQLAEEIILSLSSAHISPTCRDGYGAFDYQRGLWFQTKICFPSGKIMCSHGKKFPGVGGISIEFKRDVGWPRNLFSCELLPCVRNQWEPEPRLNGSPFSPITLSSFAETRNRVLAFCVFMTFYPVVFLTDSSPGRES